MSTSDYSYNKLQHNTPKTIKTRRIFQISWTTTFNLTYAEPNFNKHLLIEADHTLIE